VASTADEAFDAWSLGVLALELLDGGQHRVRKRADRPTRHLFGQPGYQPLSQP
jgi:hypothetical protein